MDRIAVRKWVSRACVY